jgi:thiol-disulfide isomerase/thioredoxin
MSDDAHAPLDDAKANLEPAAEDTAVRPPARRKLIGPFTARQIGLINAVVVGSALVLFVVTRPLGGSDTASPIDPGAGFYRISAETQGLDLGQKAPELVGEHDGASVQLTDLDGRPVSLASLKGRPVWINFWATWCPPCQRETPVLRDAFEAHRSDGLVLLAIDVQEPADTVRRYVTRYDLSYQIGLDVTGAVFRTYRIFGLPSHYFIDREGIIRGRYFGPLTRDQVEQHLQAITRS